MLPVNPAYLCHISCHNRCVSSSAGYFGDLFKALKTVIGVVPKTKTDCVLKSNQYTHICGTKSFLFNVTYIERKSHSHALRAQRADSFSREQQHEGP